MKPVEGIVLEFGSGKLVTSQVKLTDTYDKVWYSLVIQQYQDTRPLGEVPASEKEYRIKTGPDVVLAFPNADAIRRVINILEQLEERYATI
jgi:hypothetical protein